MKPEAKSLSSRVRVTVSRLSIRTKILLGVGIPGVLGVLAILSVVTIGLNRLAAEQVRLTRERIEENVFADLRAKTDLAHAIVRRIDETRGSDSEETARQRAREAIKNLRFGRDGKSYLWIHSLNPKAPTDPPRMVMHPTLPKLDGTDVSDFLDAKRFQKIGFAGKVYANTDEQVKHIKPVNLFIDMNAAIMASSDRTGIVNYYWPDPSRDMSIGYLKSSHVRLYEPWGWVIGTGEYADYTQEKVAEEEAKLSATVGRMRTMVAAVGLGTIAFILLVAYVLATGIAGPVRMVSARLTEIAQGKLDWQMSSELSERGDEIGDVSRALADMHASAARELSATKAALAEVGEIKDGIERTNKQTESDILEILGVVSTASGGNLTVRAKASGGALAQVATALNTLLESLSGLVRGVQGQTAQTDAAVATIATAAESMVTGATTQTREVGNAIEMVSRINEQSRLVLEASSTAATASRSTEQAAREGADVVASVVHGMGELRDSVQAGAKKVKALGDRNLEITEIVGTISRISEQTNMLALNAAIVAARAGEYGLGFGVVASEVRQLAGHAAKAADEIDRLAQAIQLETGETLLAIEQQTHSVQQQAALVTRAGETLERIRLGAAESAELVGNIRGAATQQVDGTRAVAKAVQQISTIAESTHSTAKQTLGTGQALRSLSQELVGSMGQFKVA